MSAAAVSLIVFACLFVGSLVGMLLRTALPNHHLTAESKDVIKLGAGLIGTMAALLLGLLVASAKSGYDTKRGEVTQMAAKVVFLDRLLANYGAEAEPARQLLRQLLERVINQMWPQNPAEVAQLDPLATVAKRCTKCSSNSRRPLTLSG